MWRTAEFRGIKIVIRRIEEIINRLIITMHSTSTNSRDAQERIIDKTITLIRTSTTLSSCLIETSIIKEVLDVVNVNIAEVVLALVQLLLDLLVLLLLLLLGL